MEFFRFMNLGETILWRPKNGFPQTPFQESHKNRFLQNIFIVFPGVGLGEPLNSNAGLAAQRDTNRTAQCPTQAVQ